MAVRIITTSTSTDAQNSGVEIPSGTTVGDLLILVFTANTGGYGGVYNIPPGWTALVDSDIWELGRTSIFYTYATSGIISGGNLFVNYNNGWGHIGCMLRLSQPETVNTFDTATTATSSGATSSPADHTFNYTDDDVILVGVSTAADTFTATAGAGTTVTEKLDFNTTKPQALAVYEITKSSSGGTGTMTVTRSGVSNGMSAYAFYINGHKVINTTDTVWFTDSNSALRSIILSVSDTIYFSDSSLITKLTKTWTNAVKSVSNWINQSK